MKPILLMTMAAMTLAPLGAAPLRDTTNLSGFTLFEKTGLTTSAFFAFNGSEISNKMPTIYSPNPDFTSNASERFDLYYSDASGNADTDGEYLTIDCIYDGPGSGCNIAEVQMNLTNSNLFGNSILRFVASPLNYISGSELNAIDGDVNTAASLGNTEGVVMSMTFGFPSQNSSAVPEPTTYGLMGAGLIGMAWLRQRRK